MSSRDIYGGQCGTLTHGWLPQYLYSPLHHSKNFYLPPCSKSDFVLSVDQQLSATPVSDTLPELLDP